jgi:hypothetical protein
MGFVRTAGCVCFLLAILRSLNEALHLDRIEQPWRFLIGVAMLLAVSIYLTPSKDKPK